MTQQINNEQICIRMTPPAYKILTAITNKFKNEGARGWTNSAVLNVMLSDIGGDYLKMDSAEQDKMFSHYLQLRDKGPEA